MHLSELMEPYSTKSKTLVNAVLKGQFGCCGVRVECSSVPFSHSVVSDSLWPHGLQRTRLPCPSPTPGACSHSSPLSQWCHPTISSSVVLLLPAIFPSIRVFFSELALRSRWPECWSFSISPSNAYSQLSSFRMDWLDLLAVRPPQVKRQQGLPGGPHRVPPLRTQTRTSAATPQKVSCHIRKGDRGQQCSKNLKAY